jgi:murein tripeptide amidase MpaA
MNVIEVESALTAVANAHPSLCELITLPNPTFEGKITHAARIGTQPSTAVDIFYLTGGVHAREWGSCEILVNLAVDLCDAYAGGTGIEYGGKYYSAAEVRIIMENMNIIVYPCVNPDGRNHSQTMAPLWRKNRNPADSGGVASKIGVDVNRNQDFLWDYKTHFAPAATVEGLSISSESPSSDVYHGHAHSTEQETKNINFIFDSYPRIKWYIDVHSWSEDIIYVWGDDASQITDPSMNFTNPAYDGQRGLSGDSYREFIPDGDESELISLATAFRNSLYEVRQKAYAAKPAFGLYATAGTNDDYAYSRHIADPAKGKIYSFTIEWGDQFQPPWNASNNEMEKVIIDVCSGIIGMGLRALGIGSFIVTDRDTFSSFELESISDFPDSFYVFYDGFTPNALGVPGATPVVKFLDTIGGAEIHSIRATNPVATMENSGMPDSVQRIRFKYDIHFNNANAFTLETRHIVLQVDFAGMKDIAALHLLVQPNPYMMDGAVSWLSTDLRVFQLRPGNKVNSSSSITMNDPVSHPNAPIEYIQALLGELRGHANNSTTPVFENISTNQNTSQLELSRTVMEGGSSVRVFNFAVTKVRYRANTQDAFDVRMFFRMMNTMASDLSYTVVPTNFLAASYCRSGNAPLFGVSSSNAGSEILSIPFFAQARIDTSAFSMSNQLDDFNKHNVTHVAGQESYMYFGCWLDFNQTDPQIPPASTSNNGPFSNRIPIMQHIRGIHQCLVAEIRYQPGATDPITIGTSPGSSSRLAQRNLSIVESDNPGGEATHVVQHTLLVKPSMVVKNKNASAEVQQTNLYDELVIRWNDLPHDTKATIYFPEWNVDDVIALSNAIHKSPVPLIKIDLNTIECTVTDITYIPVPSAITTPYAGLITLQLPLTVTTGQTFRVDVQQHSGLVTDAIIKEREKTRKSKDLRFSLSKRKVLGAFSLNVLVKNGTDMLATAVRNLAVLKYIALSIPATNHWYPIFKKYIQQLGDKVNELGVDPDAIKPSADDPGVPGTSHGKDRICYTGKICKVFFDCHGEFEGFMLSDCSEKRLFKCYEKQIAELALRSCKEQWFVTVCINPKKCNNVTAIIVHSHPGCIDECY